MTNFNNAAYTNRLRKQNSISTAGSLQFCCINGNPVGLYDGMALSPLYILLYNLISTCSQPSSGCANSNPDVYCNFYTSECWNIFAFPLLPNMRGIYHYLHRDSLTLWSPKHCAKYLASNHACLPSYSIINNEPKVTRITAVLFVFLFHFLKICC